MSSKKTLLLVVFLLIALVASLFLVFKTTIFFGRATVQNRPSTGLTNSYLFASPLQAKADNQEKIRLTVFILDDRGFGVQNQKVDLRLPSGLTLTTIQDTTDDTGKAAFDISAKSSGKFTVSASVQGQAIPQKITLNFY